MSQLPLDSLVVRHFRAFQDFQVPALSRVNLITGKNNVGKSCLLEAVWIYARRGSPSALFDVLTSRDEGRRYNSFRDDIEEQVSYFKYLYFGRQDIRAASDPIVIGSAADQQKTLRISAGWYTYRANEGRDRQLVAINIDEHDAAESPVFGLSVQEGIDEPTVRRFGIQPERRYPRALEPKGIPAIFVPANGLDQEEVASYWDSIALTSLETDVLSLLRIIAPEVEGVNLVADRESRNRRSPIVKVDRFGTPVPLRSLGEGMNRMFGLALALVNAQDGILLVDEIESGLHYSVHSKVWQLIFIVAQRLNIQVIATTHSWDTIEAFQKIANEHAEKGTLIRLTRKGDNIIPTVFSEEELAIATRERIEVR